MIVPGRYPYVIVVAGLLSGSALFALGLGAASTGVFVVTCGLLLVLPVASVVGILVNAAQQADWPLVAQAGLVLAMLFYAIIDRVFS